MFPVDNKQSPVSEPVSHLPSQNSGVQGFSQPPPGYQLVPSQPSVVINQPQSVNKDGWMTLNITQNIPNCPPGLEYLATIDQLLVKQKVDLLEAIGFECNNKCSIENNSGEKVFWGLEEDNDCLKRTLMGVQRPFDMQILDAHNNQVIHLHRPLAINLCCFPIYRQHRMEVSSPPGNLIGSVVQEIKYCSVQFWIKNETGQPVMRIEFGQSGMFSSTEFKIVTLEGQEIGKISKQWSGFARELFTDADFFGIHFPMDLDVRMKAVLMGACFLIDALYFEK